MLVRQYEVAAGHGSRHLRKRPWLLPVFGFLLGIAIVGAIIFAHGGRPLQASDSHVVFFV